eukprot:GILJ01001775.1.p1 GENE.GILJ01001775.1~~GILJ01001775.1.p1  ORF type:complete len:877 (-),score=135.83 GILJ01001775.1:81-2363(-)
MAAMLPEEDTTKHALPAPTHHSASSEIQSHDILKSHSLLRQTVRTLASSVSSSGSLSGDVGEDEISKRLDEMYQQTLTEQQALDTRTCVSDVLSKCDILDSFGLPAESDLQAVYLWLRHPDTPQTIRLCYSQQQQFINACNICKLNCVTRVYTDLDDRAIEQLAKAEEENWEQAIHKIESVKQQEQGQQNAIVSDVSAENSTAIPLRYSQSCLDAVAQLNCSGLDRYLSNFSQWSADVQQTVFDIPSAMDAMKSCIAEADKRTLYCDLCKFDYCEETVPTPVTPDAAAAPVSTHRVTAAGGSKAVTVPVVPEELNFGACDSCTNQLHMTVVQTHDYLTSRTDVTSDLAENLFMDVCANKLSFLPEDCEDLCNFVKSRSSRLSTRSLHEQVLYACEKRHSCQRQEVDRRLMIREIVTLVDDFRITADITELQTASVDGKNIIQQKVVELFSDSSSGAEAKRRPIQSEFAELEMLTLPGSDPSKTYIVIAHYDGTAKPVHANHGTGVACLMEIVRVLRNFNFAHNILLIAFDERGSRTRSNDLIQMLQKSHYADSIEGIIVLDTVGLLSPYQRIPPILSALALRLQEFQDKNFAANYINRARRHAIRDSTRPEASGAVGEGDYITVLSNVPRAEHLLTTFAQSAFTFANASQDFMLAPLVIPVDLSRVMAVNMTHGHEVKREMSTLLESITDSTVYSALWQNGFPTLSLTDTGSNRDLCRSVATCQTSDDIRAQGMNLDIDTLEDVVKAVVATLANLAHANL